jgi:phosphate starvation-inducible protein PhoH and related proteins
MAKLPIKFNISLSEEQKLAKAAVMEKDINFLLGDEGSGKTMLAVNIALDLFFRKDTHYKKIIITRPAVATEDLGYLPGNEKEKLDPYMAPIYETINDLYGDTDSKKNKIKKHFEAEDIRVLPIAYTRGITYRDAIIIVDEFQNATKKQLELIIGRLGPSSKLIFSGSRKQIDIKRENSAIMVIDRIANNECVNMQTLASNHRHPAIVSVLNDLRRDEEC